jgi:hypothetical protein
MDPDRLALHVSKATPKRPRLENTVLVTLKIVTAILLCLNLWGLIELLLFWEGYP